MYEFTREIQGNVNYLVLRLQPTDVIDDMAMGMLSNNRIQGISPSAGKSRVLPCITRSPR